MTRAMLRAELPVRALCLSRPAEWWDLDNDGCRLALALCRVCPAIAACAAQARRPVGVVQAGIAYSNAGVPLPLCHCGYPNELPGCCHRCGVTTLPGVPRRIYWATRYRVRLRAETAFPQETVTVVALPAARQQGPDRVRSARPAPDEPACAALTIPRRREVA